MQIPNSNEFRGSKSSAEVAQFLLNTEADPSACLLPVPVYFRRNGVLHAVGCAEGALADRVRLTVQSQQADARANLMHENRTHSTWGGSLETNFPSYRLGKNWLDRRVNGIKDAHTYRGNCWKRHFRTQW